MKSCCTTIPLFLMLTGCAQHYRPIPAGTYRSTYGDESVSVGDSGLLFHVRSYGHDYFVLEGPYDYTVERDGELFADIPTSGGHVNVYACRRWYWDGNEILQVSCKNGETKRFEAEHASQ